MTVETFEQVLTLAQAEGGLNPAFKKFLQTKFFVPVNRSDNPAQRIALHVSGQGLLISEVAERLDRGHGDSTMSLSGADIVRHLRHDADILVALSDRAFTIARDRVEWLRKAIEAAHAKAAAAKAPPAPAPSAAAAPAAAPAAAAPASAPLPAIDADPISAAWSQLAPSAKSTTVPVQVTKPAPAPAAAPLAPPVPTKADLAPAQSAPAPAAVSIAEAPAASAPPVRRGGVLDVPSLRPRAIGRANIGLSLFIPGGWVDQHHTRSLFVTDPLGKTRIEIAGHHRPDVSLSLWNGIRLSQVTQEMSFLHRSGDSYTIDYPESRGRIKGMATEYTGVFPGEETESRYLMACIWTEGTVVSIGIRAPAEEFEDKRSIYNWLLGRVEIAPQAAATTSAGASRAGVYDAPQADLSAHELDGEYNDVKMFGMSTDGRIGRLRSIAWCIGLVIPAAIMGWMLARTGPGMGSNVLAVILGLYCLWFTVRVSVLRMHDINRSGKILLAIMGVMIFLSVIKATVLMSVATIISTVFYFALFYVLPGTDGENDYGLPPPPNTTLVKVGASIVIGLQVLTIVLPLIAMRSTALLYGLMR